MKNKKFEDDIDTLLTNTETQNNNFYVDELKVKNYVWNFDKEISLPEDYRDFYKICNCATEYDSIRCIFNTPGGDYQTCIQIINHLLLTQATTVAEIYRADSAGFLMALVCDRFLIGKFSSMMVHSISLGTGGKIGEVSKDVEIMNKQNKEVINDLCSGFLTKEEMKQVLNDKNINFDEKEIIKRLKNWIPYREREQRKNKQKKKESVECNE